MPRPTRFRRLFGLEPVADVDSELAFHLAMRVRELVERGETPERARELALRRFGDYERSRSACLAIGERRRRHMVRTEYIAELRQDIGYAWRMLRRTPGFTAVAVLTLALGIGATSAIFSVVDGVLLESLPFPNAERLYWIRTLYPDGTAYHQSAPDFVSTRQDNRVFERVEAYTAGAFTLLGVGEPQEVRAASVSDGLFELLGLPVVVGRGFRAEEYRPGLGTVAVLSYGFWQRALGGDPSAVGRGVTIGGRAYTIVGVLATGAHLPDEEPDLYTPLEQGDTFSATTAKGRRSEFLSTIARSRPGLDAAAIERDLRRVGAQLQMAFPDTNATLTFAARSMPETIVRGVRRPLLVLFGAVGFVLLVACANVANLLLARASARQGELAVRAALGAGRGRLVRQLLAEAVLLGLIGGAAGLAIAYWGTRMLVAAQPADIPRLDEVGLNARVALFTFVTALLTSLLFGTLPALQSTRGRLTGALIEGGRGGDASRGGHRLRAMLVVGELALAVVLLTGAGLLIRSFLELTRVAPGFRPEQAMAFRIVMQGDAYKEREQLRDRVAAFEERLRALAGVRAVGGTTVLPLSGRGALVGFGVVGAPPPPPNVNREIAIASITPDYLRAIGTPLRSGRAFTDRDNSDAPRVAIVNEAAVRRWFADRDPVGQHVNVNQVIYEIVGVVRDVLQANAAQPALPHIFTPYQQRTTRAIRIVVRTPGDPLALAPAIRGEIRALDPNLAIADFTPLEQLVTKSVAGPRFYTALMALFAGVGLALAATGVFGVMSYGVAQRAREISVRMALGAHTGDVLRMIVGRALALTAVGLTLGIAAALALGRVIQSQLFGVRLFDLPTLGAVVLVLVGSAAAASAIPARRAARLDPASMLR